MTLVVHQGPITIKGAASERLLGIISRVSIKLRALTCREVGIPYKCRDDNRLAKRLNRISSKSQLAGLRLQQQHVVPSSFTTRGTACRFRRNLNDSYL